MQRGIFNRSLAYTKCIVGKLTVGRSPYFPIPDEYLLVLLSTVSNFTRFPSLSEQEATIGEQRRRFLLVSRAKAYPQLASVTKNNSSRPRCLVRNICSLLKHAMLDAFRPEDRRHAKREERTV